MNASTPTRESGYATAELAASLPAVLLLLFVGLFAVSVAHAQLRCLDAARDAALAASRGASGHDAAALRAPEAARVEVEVSEDLVTAEVSAPVRPLGSVLPPLTVSGYAVAPREPGSPT